MMLSLQSICHQWRSVLLAVPEYWLRGLYTTLDPYNLVTYHKGPRGDKDDDGGEDEDKDMHRDHHSYLMELFLNRSAPLLLKLRAWCTTDNYHTGWKTFKDHFES